HTTQHEFPVIDGGGHLRGVLTRNAMIEALSVTGPQTPVLDAMATNIPVIGLNSRLEKALHAMQAVNAPAIGVIDADQRLVGYISPENIGELMMVRSATAG
ncbi:MAG TPA: CBS domain-containing protein, partial [Afifellaceae bacterium]|nr:CBS domain-containing protein [Afifellaceae bacterium]